ncbi:ZIP family metal transporter [Rhodoferax aquaticus]|uniref:ZIP family metal transporter n=1 Tax=Rhodoferax aquaticus TaxID=2527691 RepID=A0A515ERJ1_9BURK|nr:ZIP family metal transporter [Rhodoferax aquaticus]QDL55282.1 ZIP family metal transporter [Rhodoferax aquaticus]
MTLVAILFGTICAGVGSVWLAAALSFGALGRYTQHMLSLAAGALLATAFMHLLPEAFESQAGAQELFGTLLVGLVFFFLLDKAELWHHGHEHHHGGHVHEIQHGHSHASHSGHAHAHPHSAPPMGSWAVLTGDSVHCFGDGVLIASAFMADLRLGVIASLAVLAHEIPHHMGDLMVLRRSSANKRAALVKVSLAGAVTAIGGFTGYWLVDQLHDYLPYFLVVASSSFIYVALADLIPQLQTRLSARQTAAQIAWLLAGIALVTVVSGLAHGH